MSCRTEFAGALAYRYCPDDPPPAGLRLRAMMRARVLDEITAEPMEVDLALSTTVRDATPRAAGGGLVGLVGLPAQLFPGLAAAGVGLDLRVAAPGYLPLPLSGTLGPLPGFPDAFSPVDLGNVAMHRLAVTLRGRTLRRASFAPTVVGGAFVSLIGYWPTFPPASVSPPAVMQPANLVHLDPGLYAARAAAAATLRRRDMMPLAGQDKLLVLPASAGERRVRLSDRSALASGTPLIVDDDDPGRRERIAVDQIDMSSAADQPAWARLSHPLARTHLAGARCRVGSLQPPGAANPLVRDALPGDETAFLTGLSGLSTGIVVEIDDGTAPPEYHQAQLYQTASDAQGFFRLPPVARVAMTLLRAQRFGLASPDDMRVTPDYRLAENRITVMFP